ncbi:MAG TPA: hypothetical protein VGB34_07005 [Candidatus Limnocylindria bacterium]
MSRPKGPREANVTLRVDADVLTWARTRALFAGTSVNKLIRDFLAEYAAVPTAWLEGKPQPWTPEGRIVQVVDPMGAGHRAAGREGQREQG